MKYLYAFIQITWGFLQSFLGLLVYSIYHKSTHHLYHGSIVTRWPRSDGLSLGLFIFVPINANKFIYKHEYGHTIQSLIFGPLYLIIIGIPSFIWSKLKKDKNTYYEFYSEKMANYLANLIIKDNQNI